MSSLPVAQTALSPGTETLEDRFRRLEATWLADIEDTSCHTTIVNHPAFCEIVSMGEAIVPLMLRDLEEGPRLWVWALPEITGVDPVSPGDGGNIAKMSLAWLRWAREHGYKIKGIEDFCPGLRGRAYQVTGLPDADYNCIAWAAGVTDTWWSPTGRPQQSYWPAGVPREETVTPFKPPLRRSATPSATMPSLKRVTRSCPIPQPGTTSRPRGATVAKWSLDQQAW